jgi:type VI secretion system Hcp family effector
MPLAASLKLADVKGTGVQKGREGEIPVIAFEHEVHSEIDPKLGRPLRSRRHAPLVIRKNLDFSSPFLAEAYERGTVFSDWVLRFFHLPRSGGEAHYFTISLTGARIASIDMVMPMTSDPDQSLVHEYEEVAWVYDSIVWGSAPPPSEGLEKGTYSQFSSSDEGKFEPDWIEEAAKQALLDALAAATEAAKKKYAEEIRKAAEENE